MFGDVVGDKIDGTCMGGGGSSNCCCRALQALELEENNNMISLGFTRGAWKDGMVVASMNECADGNDNWGSVIESS